MPLVFGHLIFDTVLKEHIYLLVSTYLNSVSDKALMIS